MMKPPQSVSLQQLPGSRSLAPDAVPAAAAGDVFDAVPYSDRHGSDDAVRSSCMAADRRTSPSAPCTRRRHWRCGFGCKPGIRHRSRVEGVTMAVPFLRRIGCWCRCWRRGFDFGPCETRTRIGQIGIDMDLRRMYKCG